MILWNLDLLSMLFGMLYLPGGIFSQTWRFFSYD